MKLLPRIRRQPTTLAARAHSDAVPADAYYDNVDVQVRLAHASSDHPLLGLSARQGRIHAPHGHLLVTDATGGGRSSLLRTIGAQAYRHGQRVVIIDSKRRSHSWALDLNGVEYVGTAIAPTLVALAAEMKARAEARDAGHWPQPITVLFEEATAAVRQAGDVWRDSGGTGPCPAAVAFRDLLVMGRAANIRIVATGHLLNPRGIAPYVRDQFTHIVGARVPASTWRALAVTEPATVTRRRGRYYLVDRGRLVPFQAAYLTHDEAVAVATHGEVAY